MNKRLPKKKRGGRRNSLSKFKTQKTYSNVQWMWKITLNMRWF